MVGRRPPERGGGAREAWRDFGRYGYIGLFMGSAVAVGTVAGIWLDGHFGTKPWCTIAGALLGIAAAFKELIAVTLKAMRKQDEADAHPDGMDGDGPGGHGDPDRADGLRD